MAERRASKPASKPVSQRGVRTKRAARDPSRVGGLTHLDARGRARMVDVGEKATTQREAVARGHVRMQAETLRVLASGSAKKGDVLAVARIAGIQAAKRTPELIPLCHGIALTGCELDFELDEQASVVHIEARARAHDRTGVEMEAMMAVSVAALTIYDMLKSIDRSMTIEAVALHEKRGGKSGEWKRAGRAEKARP